MPAYLNVPGNPVPPPPYLHTGALLHALWFDADRGKLQAILDTTVNRAPGFRFETVAAGVMLIALHVEAVTSTAPGHDGRGSAPETDVGWWMLTRGGRIGAKRELRWFPIYMWVSSAGALTVGREVYGYPKLLGRAVRASAGRDDARLELRTDHFIRFAPDARVSLDAPLFAIQRDGDGADEILPPLLNAGLANAVGLVDEMADAAALRPFGGMPMLFVKQARDIANARDTAYLGLAAATVRPDAVRSVAWLGGTHRLIVHPSASLPITADLGVQTGDRARLAFRVEQDFTAGFGAML